MDIEVEFAFEIVGTEFTEVGLVPGNNVGPTDLVQAGEEGEGSQEDGSNDRLPAG